MLQHEQHKAMSALALIIPSLIRIRTKINVVQLFLAITTISQSRLDNHGNGLFISGTNLDRYTPQKAKNVLIFTAVMVQIDLPLSS